MSGESIRCPQCGGSLDVGRSAVSAKCAYCGSTIKLKVDATGQVLPVLEGMRQDASIVAKRAQNLAQQSILLQQYESQRRALMEERRQCVADYEEMFRNMPGGRPRYGLLFFIVVLALVGLAPLVNKGDPCLFIAALVLFFAAFLPSLVNWMRRKNVENDGNERLREIDARLAKVTGQIREIMAKLERGA